MFMISAISIIIMVYLIFNISILLCMHAALTDFNSSKLEPMVSDGPEDEEEIVTVLQRKGGKPRQYLYLLLVIFAIIASKSVMQLLH